MSFYSAILVPLSNISLLTYFITKFNFHFNLKNKCFRWIVMETMEQSTTILWIKLYPLFSQSCYQISFYHITATVLVFLIFESIYLLYLIFKLRGVFYIPVVLCDIMTSLCALWLSLTHSMTVFYEPGFTPTLDSSLLYSIPL